MGDVSPPREARIAELEAENARLRTELENVRESERMYRRSAELGLRLSWSADADGRVIAMSRLFSDLTGVGNEQALREIWTRFIHVDDRERVLELWHRSLATGAPFEAEFRALLRDGGCRFALSRAVSKRDAEGRIVRWYGTTEDVHEERMAAQARRQVEEKLRESEELYRHTVELSQQIAWTATPRGRGLSLSPRFYEITGIDCDVSPEEAWQIVLHPEERQAVFTEWAAALARGEPYEAEVRIRVADGSYRQFNMRGAPRRENGRIIRWYGTTEDIEEKKATALAKRSAEERYLLAARATNDIIWDYDILAGEVDWTEQAGELFALPEMPARTPVSWWEERIHPEERAEVSASLKKAAATGAMRWSASYRFLKGDGSYANVIDRGFIIRDECGRAVRAVGAITDITDRIRAEDEMRRMQSELIHVSRISAMGTMASTLAHELNQPLAAVANYVRGSRMLLEGRNEGGMLAEALGAAEAAALRAGEIVKRLRELVSRGTVSVGTEDLLKLIEEAGVLAFVDEYALGVSHRFELDRRSRWVKADRIQIQQVLINLIRNAVEAMRNSDRREVLVSARPVETGMVEIRVSDTGCGIAPEHFDTLFSEFMTTKTEGMGIGLPISRTIVEAHGGKIWAENRPEGGAAFCFTLPAASAPRSRAKRAVNQALDTYVGADKDKR